MTQEKNSILMIDPPSGWQYGFPKPAPTEDVDIQKWLVENGYPQEEIDKFCGTNFMCRYFTTQSNEDKS